MAIIDVPAGMTFSKINSFILQRKTNRLRSKFTARGQKILYPYAVWTLDAVINETDGFLAGKVRSFLVKLEGQANSFRLPVPGVRRPMTGYVGPILTNGGAAARASSIAVDGMTAGVAILAEGDYFTVNDELKLVTEDFASNGQGQGVISFKPPLRKPVGDNVFLKILDPTVLLEAADDDVASWGTAPPKRQSARLEAVESIDI